MEYDLPVAPLQILRAAAAVDEEAVLDLVEDSAAGLDLLPPAVPA